MKETTPSRADLLAQLENLRDQLGNEMSAHYAVALADEIAHEAAALHRDLVTFAEAGEWLAAPRSCAGHRARVAAARFADRLPYLGLHAILSASPEIEEMRSRVEPIEREIHRIEGQLAAWDAEAQARRNAIAERLADAERKASEDPELVQLRKELAALE